MSAVTPQDGPGTGQGASGSPTPVTLGVDGAENAAERERAAVRDALSCSIHAARKAWLAAPMSAVIDIEYAEWLADAVMRDLPGLMREYPEVFGLRKEWLGTEKVRLITDWELP